MTVSEKCQSRPKDDDDGKAEGDVAFAAVVVVAAVAMKRVATPSDRDVVLRAMEDQAGMLMSVQAVAEEALNMSKSNRDLLKAHDAKLNLVERLLGNKWTCPLTDAIVVDYQAAGGHPLSAAAARRRRGGVGGAVGVG